MAEEFNVEEVAKKWKDVSGSLIMALHEVQEEIGYIPRNVAMQLAEGMDVPLASIYEVITFYSFFKLEAPGKHKVQVCMGTACYLKGAGALVNELKDQLKVEEGSSTADGLFELELVRCVGCCSIAPVVVVDGKVYSKVDTNEISSIISEYE